LDGLEVNAGKTKYMVTSRDRNAGQGHSVKIDNSSIGRVEEFRFLGTTITDVLHMVNEDLRILPKIPEDLNFPRKNFVLCEVGRDQDIWNYNFARGFVWV
jgi:hypothetical protein